MNYRFDDIIDLLSGTTLWVVPSERSKRGDLGTAIL
jgi:hypothetical protein